MSTPNESFRSQEDTKTLNDFTIEKTSKAQPDQGITLPRMLQSTEWSRLTLDTSATDRLGR